MVEDYPLFFTKNKGGKMEVFFIIVFIAVAMFNSKCESYIQDRERRREDGDLSYEEEEEYKKSLSELGIYNEYYNDDYY